jgi:PAS domain S-box-containing protein
MVIIDSAGTIRYANQQTAKLFGYGHDELVGRCVDELLPERLRQHHIDHRQQYWSSPRQRPMGAGLELFGCRREGGEFPVEISLSPVQDGQEMLVAAAIRDVTERKRIENELRYLQSIADTALSSKSSETLIQAVLTRLRAALRSDTATILLLDADGQHLRACQNDTGSWNRIRCPSGRWALR